MIIQCEQCRTKFKLDDEKVSDRGVKVRCAKCRHVFTVRKDVAQAEAVDAMLPDTAVAASFPASDETVRMAAAPASEPEVAAFSAEPEVAFDFGAAPVEATSQDAAPFSFDQAEAPADSSFDFGDVAFTTEAPAAPASADFGEMTMVMPPKQQAAEPTPEFSLDFGTAAVAPATPAAGEAAFDFGDALASSSISDATAQKVEFDFGDQASSAVPQAGEIDLAGFDFGTAPAVAVATPTGIDTTDFSAFNAATTPPSATAGGFSFDDAVPQSVAAPADAFDFSGVDFGMGQPQTATAAPAAEVDTFSLGEVDFSGDTAAVAVDASATAPAGTLFAPVDESVVRQQEIAKPDISFDLPGATDEQPPSITSRRRQSSTLSILIAVITVVVLAVLGYMAYSFISDGPKAVSLFGKAGAPAEDGKITVQNIKAYFVPKAAAGELLVITGEALNNFKKPRAALQVKGMVFGAANQTVATKTAYAGNLLTKEQLAEMPAEKIEAAMNNQFGDSLANLEVQPGKTIPFTIVIVNPPADGKEFGVEPVGSTVAAAGK